MVKKPSTEFWQELRELDKSLWGKAQERDRYRLDRSAREYWRPHDTLSAEAPADPRDICVWSGRRAGIWRSALEGILHVKRHVAVPVAFNTVVVQHDTAYQYLVRPNPGEWSPGWVATTTAIGLLPDTDEELRDIVNFEDLKNKIEFDSPPPEDEYQALMGHMRQGDSMASRLPLSEIPKPRQDF